MTASQTARIGLVNLPTLTTPLTSAGFQLFGGGPFREAALAIKAAAESGTVSAIFVADRPEAGVKAWLTRMISHGSIVVIIREDVPRLDIDQARSVDLPATLGELLAVAGLSVDLALAAIRIGVDGHAEAESDPDLPALASLPALPSATVGVSAFDDVLASPIAFAAVRAAQASSAQAIAAHAADAADTAAAARRQASPWDDEVDQRPESSQLATPPMTASPMTTPPMTTPPIPVPPFFRQPIPARHGIPLESAGNPAARATPWDESAAVIVEVAAPAALASMPRSARPDDWFDGAPAPEQPLAVHAALAPQNVRSGDPVSEMPARAPQAPYSATNGPSGVAAAPSGSANSTSAPHRPAGSTQTDPRPAGPSTANSDVQQWDSESAAPRLGSPSRSARTASTRYTDSSDDTDAAVEIMLASAGTAVEQLTPIQVRRPRGQGAPMAIICAEKGGVGKTNTSLALAQRAADLAPGKSVVLVDMNRGQGDIRKYLKLGGAQLPSILDAAISGNMSDAVLSAEQITSARHSQLPPISFGVVLAPEMEAADFRIVTADVYQQTIDLVRATADLVIIDTQIIEIHDTSGLVDGLIVPALAHDAFGIALTDTSTPGVSNLVAMLKWFSTQGVPTNRLMIVINRALASYDTDVLRGMLGRYGTFAGAITEKSTLAQQANMGRIPHHDPSLAPVLDAALLRITGWPCFQPAPPPTKRGFFSRGKKSKK